LVYIYKIHIYNPAKERKNLKGEAMRNSTLALLLLGLVLAAQLQVAHGRSKGGASDSAARVRASLLLLSEPELRGVAAADCAAASM
jgi:hypothetical protein